MKKKLIITSGTGFLGRVLIGHLKKSFEEIVIISRGKHADSHNVRYLQWDAHTLGDWKTAFKDVDVIINMTGKSVDCRYNEANKKRDSRITCAVGRSDFCRLAIAATQSPLVDQCGLCHHL